MRTELVVPHLFLGETTVYWAGGRNFYIQTRKGQRTRWWC